MGLASGSDANLERNIFRSGTDVHYKSEAERKKITVCSTSTVTPRATLCSCLLAAKLCEGSVVLVPFHLHR